MTTEKELREIFARIFRVTYEEYISWNYDEVAEWDSLAQISLILEVEDRWGLEIDSEQIPKLKKFLDFLEFLKDNLEDTNHETKHE